MLLCFRADKDIANAKKNFQMRHTTAGNANHINPRSFGVLVLPEEERSQG